MKINIRLFVFPLAKANIFIKKTRGKGYTSTNLVKYLTKTCPSFEHGHYVNMDEFDRIASSYETREPHDLHENIPSYQNALILTSFKLKDEFDFVCLENSVTPKYEVDYILDKYKDEVTKSFYGNYYCVLAEKLKDLYDVCYIKYYTKYRYFFPYAKSALKSNDDTFYGIENYNIVDALQKITNKKVVLYYRENDYYDVRRISNEYNNDDLFIREIAPLNSNNQFSVVFVAATLQRNVFFEKYDKDKYLNRVLISNKTINTGVSLGFPDIINMSSFLSQTSNPLYMANYNIENNLLFIKVHPILKVYTDHINSSKGIAKNLAKFFIALYTYLIFNLEKILNMGEKELNELKSSTYKKSFYKNIKKAVAERGVVYENKYRNINLDIENYEKLLQDCYTKKMQINAFLMNYKENVENIIKQITNDIENVISKNKYINDIIYNEHNIEVITTTLELAPINIKYKRTKHVGPYKILIPLISNDYKDIKIKAGAEDTPTINGYGGEGCCHPHVEYNNNKPCWGNLGGTIAELFGSFQFGMLIEFIINFLKTANPEDVMGKNWVLFPDSSKE